MIAAPLIGQLGDRLGRGHMVMLGYLVYLLMSLGFAFASAPWQIVTLFVLFGVFYAIDEAQSRAFIADLEQERRLGDRSAQFRDGPDLPVRLADGRGPVAGAPGRHLPVRCRAGAGCLGGVPAAAAGPAAALTSCHQGRPGFWRHN